MSGNGQMRVKITFPKANLFKTLKKKSIKKIKKIQCCFANQHAIFKLEIKLKNKLFDWLISAIFPIFVLDQLSASGGVHMHRRTSTVFKDIHDELDVT